MICPPLHNGDLLIRQIGQTDGWKTAIRRVRAEEHPQLAFQHLCAAVREASAGLDGGGGPPR